MTEATETATHLAGPWQAVMADKYGFTYDSTAPAIEDLGEEEEVTISVRRRSALPDNGERSGAPRLPSSNLSGDVAYEVECYLIDPDDDSTGADARWAQAQAMAAGLNAATDA